VYSFLTVTNLVLVITFGSGAFSGLVAQPDKVMMNAKVKYLMKLSLSYNAFYKWRAFFARPVKAVVWP
jgi:hypothetical protein